MILVGGFILEMGNYMNLNLRSPYSKSYSLEWGDQPNIIYINYSQHAMGSYGF